MNRNFANNNNLMPPSSSFLTIETKSNYLNRLESTKIDENVSLVWKNLRYSVSKNWFNFKCFNARSNEKIILNRLNGHLNCNTLNGFLGPSGAGKTTLLNCLNGAINSGLTDDSEIYLRKSSDHSIRFIQQHVHETIIGGMTVRQGLYYAFCFKNPGQYNQFYRHLQSILKQLLLDETILETPFEKCSGGEQRRIAIAQELMSLKKPTFLFIDEPTTGLDSHAALLVMQCLRRLIVDGNMTILCSIHAPNSEILSLFDKLYILAKGGVCIYSDSPTNLRKTLNQTIIDNEILKKLDDFQQPPIEIFLEIACQGINDTNVRLLANRTLINEQESFRLSDEIISKLRFMSRGIENPKQNFSISDFFLQLRRMFNIVFIAEYRKLFFQAIFYAAIFFMTSTLFDRRMIRVDTCYSLNMDEESMFNYTCSDRLNAQTFSDEYQIYQAYMIAIIGMSIICISSISFMPILKVFSNEHSNQWYSMGVFYWSFVIIRLIELTITSVYMAAAVYFFVDHTYIDDHQMNWFRFGHFVFYIWIFAIYLQSCGHVLSLVSLGYSEVAILGGLTIINVITFCTGYMFSFGDKNALLNVLSKILPIKPITNGLIYAAYGIDRCDEDTEISFVIEDFGIDPKNIYSDVSKTLLIILYVRIITFVLMIIRFSLKINKKYFHQSFDKELKPIYYSDILELPEKTIIDLDRISRNKDDNEIEFENFSREKMIVAWRSVTLFASKSFYEIRSSKDAQESKLILRDLNGQFRFGTLNALMGPSGAGKTSLLKVLNGRSKTRLNVESEFYLSKYTPTRTCYITQEVSGHLMPGMTAKQLLIFASRLKNVSEGKEVDHESIALNILNELDLDEAKDTMVDRCSGGQRKRLALGIELTSLRMPNLICIDEPTSGLDSSSSVVVTACLRKLSRLHNLCIITSIHQPNTDVLMMFDDVYVLAKGGVCVYSGRPNEIGRFLAEQNLLKNEEKKKIFPIEELIKYSCLKLTDQQVKTLAEATNIKLLNKNNMNDLKNETQLVLNGIPNNRTRFSLRSIWILILRYCYFIRGFQWIHLLIFPFGIFADGMVMGLIFDSKIALPSGCINLEDDFNNTCRRTEEQIIEEKDLRTNFAYTVAYLNMFLNLIMLQSALMFSKDFVYFINEHRNGWYSTGAFYIMKILVEILPLFFVTFVFVYEINIYEAIRPGIYLKIVAILILSSLALQGAGYLLAIIASGDFSTLIAYFVGLSILSVLLSNSATPIHRLHYVYQFISNFTPFRFAFEALILFEYGFNRCGHKQLQAVLYRLNLMHEQDDLMFAILMLSVNIITYRLIAFIILWLRSNPFQNRRSRADRIILFYNNQLKPSNAAIPGLTCHQEFTLHQIAI